MRLMMTTKMILGSFWFALMVSCSAPPPESLPQPYNWQQSRGVNVGCDINETDVADLAQSGADFMRLSMPVCAFMELDSPYDYRPEAFTIFADR